MVSFRGCRFCRLMCGKPIAFRPERDLSEATPPLSRASSIGKAEPFRTSGGRAAAYSYLIGWK